MEGTKRTTGEGRRSAPSPRFPLVSGDNTDRSQGSHQSLVTTMQPLPGCASSRDLPSKNQEKPPLLFTQLPQEKEAKNPHGSGSCSWSDGLPSTAGQEQLRLATVAKAAAWWEGEGRAWMKLTWSLLLLNSDSKAWGEEGAF